MRSTTVTLFVVLLVLAWTTVAPAIPIDKQAAETQAAFDELTANDGALLSPANYQEAEKHLSRAKLDLQKGKDIKTIEGRLQKANEAIAAANKVLETANQIFKAAIEARIACIDVEADKHSPKDFVKAEDIFKIAVQAMEADKLQVAGQKAREAEGYYREAELVAIKVDVLGRARDAIMEAADIDAEKYTPTTIQLARDLLEEATSILDIDRTAEGLTKAKDRARKSAYEARHAMYMTRRAMSLDKGKTGLEIFILESEDYLNKIEEILALKVAYDNGFGNPTKEMAAAIHKIKESWGADTVRLGGKIDKMSLKIEGLKEKNDTLNATVEALTAEIAGLKADHAEELAAIKSELEMMQATGAQADSIRAAREAAAKALEEKIQSVYDAFDESEAAVLMQENDLIVRVVGLQFDVGAATLQPASFGLLGKVQKILHQFLENRVEIEGHTDSQGSDAINMTLSKDRADAVLQYLLGTSDKLNPGKIRSSGYGETKPIASNETKEGRAKNRRIEVMIKDVKK